MSRFAFFFLLFATIMSAQDHSQPAPHLTEQDGRYALIVGGAPFLVLGGQINNSSSWPATMPDVWPVIEGMHANTVEAPVYWEQMEPQPGKFDFSPGRYAGESGTAAPCLSRPALVWNVEEWRRPLRSGLD